MGRVSVRLPMEKKSYMEDIYQGAETLHIFASGLSQFNKFWLQSL